MRWVRYRDGGRVFFGVLDDDSIREGVGNPFHGWQEKGQRIADSSAHPLLPSDPS